MIAQSLGLDRGEWQNFNAFNRMKLDYKTPRFRFCLDSGRLQKRNILNINVIKIKFGPAGPNYIFGSAGPNYIFGPAEPKYF